MFTKRPVVSTEQTVSNLVALMHKMVDANSKALDQLREANREQMSLIRLLTDTVAMPEGDQLQRAMNAAEALGETPSPIPAIFARRPVRRVPRPSPGPGRVEAEIGGDFGGSDPD